METWEASYQKRLTVRLTVKDDGIIYRRKNDEELPEPIQHKCKPAFLEDFAIRFFSKCFLSVENAPLVEI